MSNGVSSVMGESSSNSSCSSSATKIGNLIKTFDNTSIFSCVIGCSKLKYYLNHNMVHTAILLCNKKANLLDKKTYEKTEGILLEYGYYPPDKAEDREKEENNINNGLVIYRYGEKGGLRFYVNSIKDYKKIFCDVGYICLDIKNENQISFSSLIEKIAPISENKWIKANYKASFINNFNCHTFTSHVVDILKPLYDSRLITKGKEVSAEGDKESIIPDTVLNTLRKYED